MEYKIFVTIGTYLFGVGVFSLLIFILYTPPVPDTIRLEIILIFSASIVLIAAGGILAMAWS